MSMRSVPGITPNLQQLGHTRLQSALLAGHAVRATGNYGDDEAEELPSEADTQRELDAMERARLQKLAAKMYERLRGCVKMRLAKDKEIKELEAKLKFVEDRLTPQANQMQQLLRRAKERQSRSDMN